ncbi:MAG: hypothetical protein JW818_12600 [Pirellulales bacterium]|nr:hypothetical protein [Pirellulales bacterium]
MATVHDSQHKPSAPQQPDDKQLHRDRVNLVLVLVVFGALLALTMWLASLSPPPGGMHYGYPLVP